MSFGGSNPPWQRNAPIGNAGHPNAIPNLQTQMMNTGLVFQNLAMAQQTPQSNMPLMQPMGTPNIGQMNNTQPMFTQAIQYQNSRGRMDGLNPHAFSSVPNASQMISHQQLHPVQNSQAHQNQMNAAGAPFKWNSATVVQQGNNQRQLQLHPQPQMQSNPSHHDFQVTQSQNMSIGSNTQDRSTHLTRGSNHIARKLSPPRKSSADRSARKDDEDRRKRDERDRERRDRERDRERERRDERSPIRKVSPRRKAKPIPRYMVQVPKINLVSNEADVLELRRRYTNLYVPSDFFNAQIRWADSFPPHAPFTLQKPCTFHIFHKSVVNPNEDDQAVYDAPDADSSFAAKVMLMGVPPMNDFYRKCFTNAEEKDREDLLHPTRLINFLVGVAGKNETMAIGGSWSPSLDGSNPNKDPSVLIRTAIRTCKALTGIDLSSCTKWYRFVELYYRRIETIRKGRIVPAKTQTVVIFLPEVRSCLPTHIEWDELAVKYKSRYLIESNKQDADENDTSVGETSMDGDKCALANISDERGGDLHEDTAANDEDNDGTLAEQPTLDENEEEPDTTAALDKDDSNTKPEPTHYSELVVKTMKVTDLRDELDARGLSSKGLKPQLTARLTKALKIEETSALAECIAEDSNQADNSKGSAHSIDCGSNDCMDIDMADIVIIDEYDSTKNETRQEELEKKELERRIDEREKRWLEKRYRLPEHPQILCHPVPQRSLDKFTCEVMSLSVLLDYRPEDTKKHCFEVSLFAELFNEMLMRDFGFNIYKMLSQLPDNQLPADVKEARDAHKKPEDGEPTEKRARKEPTDSNESSRHSKKSDSSKKSEIDSKVDKEKQKDKDKDKERKRDRSERGERSERDRKQTRRDDGETDDDAASMLSADGKRRETKKMVIVNPALLLSFIYFDQSHCGYIFSNHLEDLFHALGLMLSRADTKKIINRVAPRSLFYRKLTDKPKDEKHDAVEVVANVVEDLGKGNNRFMPIFQTHEPIAAIKPIECQFVHPADVEKNVDLDQTTSDASQMVLYKGALVDIAKLMQQMSRAELAREQTEQRFNELIKTNNELQSSNSRAKDKLKDLQSELKSSHRKLSDAESGLTSANKKNGEYYSILSGVYDKISPIFVKHERSSKKDTSRDKERKDREKERSSISSANKDKDAKDKEPKKKEEPKDKDYKDVKGKKDRNEVAIEKEPKDKGVAIDEILDDIVPSKIKTEEVKNEEDDLNNPKILTNDMECEPTNAEEVKESPADDAIKSEES